MEDRYLKTAYSYLFIRDFQRAFDTFQSAIAEHPENAAYRFHASITALRNGCLPEALQLAEEAVTLAPEDMRYWQHYGVIMARTLVETAKNKLNQGEFHAAKDSYELALSFDPLNEEADAFMTALLAHEGDVKIEGEM